MSDFPSAEQQARDLLDQARQVLGAIPPGEEWVQVGLGNIHANPVGSQPPRAKTWSSRIGDLVAEAPTLIRELAAEVSRLRAQETRIRQVSAELSELAAGAMNADFAIGIRHALAALDTEGQQ